MSDTTSSSLAQLNSFLRGELSAVETYYDALRSVSGPDTRAALEDCARSHELRVQCLRDAIARMGGTPARGSGAWGTFAGLVEAGARAFGGRAAVSALARGEDRGLDDYRGNLRRLDGQGKELVERLLLPAQERTRRAIHDVRRLLS
ncbi:MAG TPA: DUF2383 domain-containing protein [Polyangiaceae bacterium]|nr:DUF2383 domain-containing protein [Polyangiaceae bacterium]